MSVRARTILATALLAGILLVPTRPAGSNGTPAPFEIYILFGDTAAWMGDQIRYTLTEPASVEARFLSISGEIIVLLPIGQQAPGQYTVPFDGTKDGSPFAGLYQFELYFGDEYAAKFHIAVRPLTPES